MKRYHPAGGGSTLVKGESHRYCMQRGGGIVSRKHPEVRCFPGRCPCQS